LARLKSEGTKDHSLGRKPWELVGEIKPRNGAEESAGCEASSAPFRG
jgi:hypothetical protein